MKKKASLHITMSFLLIAGIGVILVILNKGLDLSPKKIPSALINKKAHHFAITWLQGKENVPVEKQGRLLSLNQFAGKPVILNFWASWCFSCRHEAKDFEKFWQKYQDQVHVIGIAIQDTPQAALAFAKQYGKSYILGFDEDGTTSIDYGVSGVPETFIIDRNGFIVHKETGPVTFSSLETLTADLLPKS